MSKLTMTKRLSFAQKRALDSIKAFFEEAEWIDYSIQSDYEQGRTTLTGRVTNSTGKVMFVKVALGILPGLGGFYSTPAHIEARWADKLGVKPTSFKVSWSKNGPSYEPTSWGDKFLNAA